MSDETINVALLGAGYIASWHASAIARIKNANVTAVCDLSPSAATGLADTFGAKAYTDLGEMLANDPSTVVHVLTTPNAHYDPAKKILEAGKHCFVEKPFCLSSEDAEELVRIADANNVKLGVNHNFLMLPGYEKLCRDIKSGKIGMLDHVQLNWRFPLGPLRAGPYGLWMLRAPENILLEIGSHLFAFIADLFDEIDGIQVRLRHPVTIPGDITHFQGWSITAQAGVTSITADISLIEGHDDRSVSVRGTGASAHYNFAEDSYRIEQTPMLDIVVGPLALQFSQAAQAVGTGITNATRQLTSLNNLAPYGLSMTRGIQSFYQSIRKQEPVDRRLSPQLAANSLRHIEDVLDIAGPQLDEAQEKQAQASKADFDNGITKVESEPTVLVIGGTGFIGRHACHALADAGYHVRVFSRGRVSGFERPDGKITGFTGDLKSEEDLLAALNGIETVYHFARATESTWEGYLRNDVDVTRHIGQCCLKAGIERLVYTGTISCYDASNADVTISENVPFDLNLDERDLYSRSKAKCEEVLLDLYREENLPLVIARPGIVVGKGGPLQHWGIAMWRGSTACKLWGDGKNKLPFVLVEDTAEALVNMMTAPSIEGEAFNLVGDPLLSARDYFSEISQGYGVKMRAIPTPTWRYFLVDTFKYVAKKYLARRKNLTKPTLRDWRSRAQVSPYDNEKPKKMLGWAPETDRSVFIKKGITGISLFGVDAASSIEPFSKN